MIYSLQNENNLILIQLLIFIKYYKLLTQVSIIISIFLPFNKIVNLIINSYLSIFFNILMDLSKFHNLSFFVSLDNL